MGRIEELKNEFEKAKLAFDANPCLHTAKALSDARVALREEENKEEEYVVETRDTEEDKELIEKTKQNINKVKNQLK